MLKYIKLQKKIEIMPDQRSSQEKIEKLIIDSRHDMIAKCQQVYKKSKPPRCFGNAANEFKRLIYAPESSELVKCKHKKLPDDFGAVKSKSPLTRKKEFEKFKKVFRLAFRTSVVGSFPQTFHNFSLWRKDLTLEQMCVAVREAGRRYRLPESRLFPKLADFNYFLRRTTRDGQPLDNFSAFLPLELDDEEKQELQNQSVIELHQTQAEMLRAQGVNVL